MLRVNVALEIRALRERLVALQMKVHADQLFLRMTLSQSNVLFEERVEETIYLFLKCNRPRGS